MRTRWRFVTVAVVLAVGLGAWAVLRPARLGAESEEILFLHGPGDGGDTRELARLARGDGTLPPGVAFLRFPLPNGRIGWSGLREYDVEVLASPGDLVRVTVSRAGHVEQLVDGLRELRALPLVLSPPFWGAHTYRIDIETAAAGVLSYELDLAGTIHLDLVSVSRLWRQ